MKRLLAFLTVCLSILPAQAKYAGGTGEPNDPYQIATAADLIALGETPDDYDKHFLLVADIDLDPNLPGRKVFDKAVIAPDTDPNDTSGYFDGFGFAGSFDGNGHRILHLTMRGRTFLGLFGRVLAGAELKDIEVTDVNIVGWGDCVGGLAAWNWDGTVTRCRVSGTIRGGRWVGGLVGLNGQGLNLSAIVTRSRSTSVVDGHVYVGGLVGENRAQVSQSSSLGKVSGDHDVGGLVGYNSIGRIAASYSGGSASGTEYVGGLAGINGRHIIACYSYGLVNGENKVGGLVGVSDDEYGSITSSFWDVEISGQGTSAGGTGETTPRMQTASTFLNTGWDFVGETANGTEDIWWILEGKDHPRLWWQLPADDFEDGKVGPLWMVYEVDPDLVQIKEVNGRLETTASSQAQNVDAFYVSDGWRLDVTKGFSIRVDFHFGKQGGGDGRVTLGVIPSLDPSAMQWAEFEAGCFDTGPFYLYEVRDGAWVQERVTDRSAVGGTLYLSYNPDTDELYFSPTGYGKPNAWETVTGLLAGRWAGEPVYVILGGGSEGMSLAGEQAWLDNFTVDVGAIVP